jgi:pimeloyl-ACP methyl ester carboxylesterase
MEYVVGVGLALGVGVFATLTGLDRDRAFYPTVLIVVAAYYDLFAVMSGGEALGVETGVAAFFVCASVIGFRTNLWIVAAALAGHGLFDLVHGQLIENAGVPGWWPMFCLSYDVVAGVYLAWLLISGRLREEATPGFGARIRPHVKAELAAAAAAELTGDPAGSFRHLERAHVLGQGSTVEHVRVHARMLAWGLRQRRAGEVAGQALRIIGAATKTGLGLIPHGNTGGANVGPFKQMPIPDNLAATIASVRTTAGTLLAVVLAVATLFGASACSATPRDVRIAEVDGHQVAYRVMGSGKPVIVMLSGLQHGMATFQDVAPELARSATVIVYDRSGYGGSSNASGPRDAEGAERELSGLLEATGIPGPYVLAGHSLGGLFAEYYAARHPDQIAGLILEDSRPADFARRCGAAGVSMCSPLPEMVRGEPRAVQAEVLALPATEAQVESAGAVKGKPVLVMSRPAAVGATSFDTVWTTAQADLAARYPGSLHMIASAGGHYVHSDQRAWYVGAVKEFLSRLN